MIDYYLKTPGEAEMIDALVAAGAAILDDAGRGLLPADGVLIDMIGTHYVRTGGTDEDPVYEAIPGWHVNVRSASPLYWPDGIYTGQPHAPWRSFGPLPGAETGPSQPLPAITSTQVDAERDRRISSGFEFHGVHYQSRLPTANHPGDWDVFSGKALEAFIAVSSGVQPGDLRWSDPEADFSWIAADNSRVPMDAQTVIELCKVASMHRSRHTFAGSDLKAMQPIPQDYADDKYWPA